MPPKVATRRVTFQQHHAENCISGCSECLFFVACRSMSANVGGATEGGIPRSLLPARPMPRGQRRQRDDRTVRGAKGTFQGEQRPTETDHSHDNKWRLR